MPTRAIVGWLSHADGRADPHVRVPPQPAFLAVIPGNDAARVNYQRRCTAWIATVLPLQIARQGDDADTAAAHVFDAIEECDGAAGLGTIPRERLVAIMRAKRLL